MPHRRRKDDTDGNWDAWQAESRRGRTRTLLAAVITSGLLSLFLGYEFETSAYNQQAERSRTNCELTQNVANLLSEISLDVARASAKQDPDVSRRWESYSVTFSKAVPPRAASCDDVFKKRSTIPFIE